MGLQVLESASHYPQEANFLVNGVGDGDGDGANVTNGGTQQTGVLRVDDPGPRDGGQNGIPCRLVLSIPKFFYFALLFLPIITLLFFSFITGHM